MRTEVGEVMTDKEKIVQLEKENAELREKCRELEKKLKDEKQRWEHIFASKQTQYMETLGEMNKVKREKELIHNARGAGRKPDYEKRAEDIRCFTELYEQGYDMKTVMYKMKISRSTFYRLKKKYLQIEKTFKQK